MEINNGLLVEHERDILMHIQMLEKNESFGEKTKIRISLSGLKNL